MTFRTLCVAWKLKSKYEHVPATQGDRREFMEQNAYLKKIYKISNLTSIFRRRIGMLVSGRALAQLVESLLQMLGYTPSIE